ncbi:hypothetical protein [Streptomyces sp. NPDC051572]|nr:hypothetical protein OG496_51535 [Streptomyces sp. NBC_00988]
MPVSSAADCTAVLRDYSELRAAGFSPSGQTLAVATSSDLSLWTRRAPH